LKESFLVVLNIGTTTPSPRARREFTMADSKPIRTADVTQEVAIRMGQKGNAAAPAQTVMDFWDTAVKERGDRPALHHKVVKKV
jgi:hypothetical protein